MKLGDARVFSVSTFSSDTAPQASTPLDRWVLARIRSSVPLARLRFVLWDGFELPHAGDAPVGTIVFRNRRALFSWVWNPDLNFGEAYMFGAVDLQGDLVAMLCEIYRTLRRSRQGKPPVRQAANDERAARENVHRHYDLGNEFYRLWLDREMVYTCAYFPSPDATLEAPDREDGSRLPQAGFEGGRNSGRSRLRMGIAGAVHGQAVRRVGSRVQRVFRADCLCAIPRERRGPR